MDDMACSYTLSSVNLNVKLLFYVYFYAITSYMYTEMYLSL